MEGQAREVHRRALPRGLRLLGVLPFLATHAQRARSARVVPASVLIVPALPRIEVDEMRLRPAREKV